MGQGCGAWRRLLVCFLVVFGTFGLSSCGGGGGGDGGSGGSTTSAGNLVFAADKTAVSFDYQQNETPAAQTVTITATGQYTGTLYVSASVTGPEIATPIPITVTGTTATVQISVVPQLAAGTYSGSITLMACSDSACAHQVGNSPLKISYQITVQGTLQVTPATVALNAVTGTTTSQVVSVALPEGTSSFSTSVVGSSPWLTISNATASSFTINAGALAPGSYSGQVVVTAGAASETVNVTYTVSTPPLLVTPSSVSFNAVSGSTASQAITVQLPSGQTSATQSVSPGTPWLTISNATASSFTLNAASLPSGVYQGAVQVSSGTQIALIVVSYTVTPPPGGDQALAVSPTSLTLNAYEGASTSATLTVTPPSWNPQVTVTAEYPIGTPSGWLTLTPVAGGETVLANAATLTTGSYTANLRLHAAYPSTDILVPVALTVGVGLVQPANVLLSVNAETPSAALSGSVAVNVASGPATPFTATSNAPWLILTTSSGQTGQSLAYRVDPTQIAAALTSNQVSSAQVTVTPGTASMMAPVSFNVQVTGNLPLIQTLAPYVQLPGQPARVILRGSGFSAITAPNRFAIDGQAPTSITQVNDTEVVALLAALTAGSHTVSVSNALGIATATGRVLASAAPSYSYAAIATGGLIRSIAYDPERDALYAANYDAETIMSFRHTSASGSLEESWTTASVPLVKAFDVGLTQDGVTLLATSSAIAGDFATGSIQALDPASLAARQSLSVSFGFTPVDPAMGFGIPTTNDARSWLGVAADGTLGSPAYITPQSLTPVAFSVPAGIIAHFYNGPAFAVSRDGERLFMVTDYGESPASAVLYLNAADSVLTANPAGLTSVTRFSMSDAADRVLFDNVILRDNGFNLIGYATVPDSSYTAQRGLVTPDGSRVYVLAYPSNAGAAGVTPRVFVFDAATPSTAAQANLDVLGSFDIADYPGCVPNLSSCLGAMGAAISLDGRTLFFAAEQNLLVVPVPGTLSTTAAARAQRRATSTVPWPVNVH